MHSMPSLNQLSAPQLIQRLQQCNLKNDFGLYPIWLNNQGQPVIGVLPKATFQLQCDNHHYHLIKQQRQSLCADKGSYTQTRYDNFDINTLPNLFEHYQDAQLPASRINNTCQHGYQNGFIGFISYDLSADNLANVNYVSQNQPLAYVGHYDIYLTYQEETWQLHTTTQEAIENLDRVQQWLAKILEPNNMPPPTPLSLQPLWQQADYQQAFERVQNYLIAGDCYQINLTQCWQGKLSAQSLVDYLPSLYHSTNAPFAGYLGLKDFELLSCSPELFFTFDTNAQGEHTIITKPIKGTMPRGATADEDTANKRALATSEKDTAENVMIVDLLRNDLGKYAKTGTVKVPKLFDIESFSNVHHMVSTITATLKENVSPWAVLVDSLPAGSITGTPKKRAVEIINELEAKPRGAYCGTMGYLNFDGTGQWNVLIRTLQSAGGEVSLWAGGGITIASNCGAEYQECFDKVGNLLKILQP